MTADRRGDEGFAALLLGSFRRLVGRPMVEVPADDRNASAAWLYAGVPFCLLAHDGAADPRFIYANEAAQHRFGYGWDEFTALPSRMSAEPDAREERRRALDAVIRHGFVDDYSGVRVARSGRRFCIEGATVWNLVDAEGVRHGQAALFRRWRDLA